MRKPSILLIQINLYLYIIYSEGGKSVILSYNDISIIHMTIYNPGCTLSHQKGHHLK